MNSDVLRAATDSNQCANALKKSTYRYVEHHATADGAAELQEASRAVVAAMTDYRHALQRVMAYERNRK
jgi:hypothetical protein